MKTRHPTGARKVHGRRGNRRARYTRQLVVSSLICTGSLLGADAALAAGGDTQATATCISALPYTDSGTTVGATDNFDLPADVTSPTLTAGCATVANGAGPAGSLPRGAIYTGTGTGPDVVYRLSFPSGNPDTLTITMTPAAGLDLALIVYCNTCSNALSDGLVVSDRGTAGGAETVTVGNIAAGTDLYVVVDGYSTGGALPGPSGAYTLNITSSGSTQPVCGAAVSADLAITATDGVTTAVPGQSVTYTLTATNAGPNAATGAQVADTFPAALTATWTCVGAGGGTCTASGSGNIADTVDLPVGASVTYTVAASIAAGATGTLSNSATVSVPAGVTDPTPANNMATDTDTLAPQADLSITLTDGVTAATPGNSLTYTLVATNAGPSAAPGSAVTNTLPAALTGATWTCAGSGGATCTASGSGNIADTVNLPAGGSVTYTVAATVAPGATGTLANTVTVSAPAGITDTSPSDNAATDTDTLAAAPSIVQPIPALGGGGMALLLAALSALGAFFAGRRRR